MLNPSFNGQSAEVPAVFKPVAHSVIPRQLDSSLASEINQLTRWKKWVD